MEALVIVFAFAAGGAIGFRAADVRCARRHRATWFIRPAPAPGRHAGMPEWVEPGTNHATVQTALYGRTNLPHSTSEFE